MRSERISNAIALAARVHAKQTDKAGQPYIFHPLYVMRSVDTSGLEDDEYKLECLLISAVLHDVIEDCEDNKSSLRDIIWNEFGGTVYETVDILTKYPDDEYETEYIARIERSWMARRVKIADLNHNMQISRIPGKPTSRDLKRLEKYARSIERLETIERSHNNS